MPIYEYECSNCGKRFEKLQSITAESLTECVNCGGGPIRRVMQPVGIIFKGSGWYINDSRKSSGSGEGDASSGKAEKGKSDTKSESGGESSSKSEGSSETSPKKDSSTSTE